MSTFRKSHLNLALGAALGACMLMPTVGSAFSINVDDGVVYTDDSGDALLFPVYTSVIDSIAGLDSFTSYSVTNTSPVETLAVKIRFREQRRSMDVLDVIVVLSPDDKFDFWVDQAEGERPTMRWTDNSCVIGVPGGAKSVQFPAPSLMVGSTRGPHPDNPGVTPIPRAVDADMSVGHIEVIGMANLQNAVRGGSNLADAAAHGPDGVPANCNTLRTAFLSREYVDQIIGATDAGNWLIGRYVITARGAGIEMGSNAISLKNTFYRPYLTAQSDELCTRTTINPANDLNHPCHSLYAWDAQEFDHPHLGDINIPFWSNGTIANIDVGLDADSLEGDWSNNGMNFVSTDWIINFPTKYTYTDWRANHNPQWHLVNYFDESVANDWPNGHPWLQTTEIGTPFGAEHAGLCLTANFLTVFDTEERSTFATSPDGLPYWPLCNETTVVTMHETGRPTFPSVIQYEADRLVLTFDDFLIDEDTNRGWADMELFWKPVTGTPGRHNLGAAVMGANVILRSTDAPEINNGSLTDLQRHNFHN